MEQVRLRVLGTCRVRTSLRAHVPADRMTLDLAGDFKLHHSPGQMIQQMRYWRGTFTLEERLLPYVNSLERMVEMGDDPVEPDIYVAEMSSLYELSYKGVLVQPRALRLGLKSRLADASLREDIWRNVVRGDDAKRAEAVTRAGLDAIDPDFADICRHTRTTFHDWDSFEAELRRLLDLFGPVPAVFVCHVMDPEPKGAFVRMRRRLGEYMARAESEIGLHVAWTRAIAERVGVENFLENRGQNVFHIVDAHKPAVGKLVWDRVQAALTPEQARLSA